MRDWCLNHLQGSPVDLALWAWCVVMLIFVPLWSTSTPNHIPLALRQKHTKPNVCGLMSLPVLTACPTDVSPFCWWTLMVTLVFVKFVAHYHSLLVLLLVAPMRRLKTTMAPSCDNFWNDTTCVQLTHTMNADQQIMGPGTTSRGTRADYICLPQSELHDATRCYVHRARAFRLQWHSCPGLRDLPLSIVFEHALRYQSHTYLKTPRLDRAGYDFWQPWKLLVTKLVKPCPNKFTPGPRPTEVLSHLQAALSQATVQQHQQRKKATTVRPADTTAALHTSSQRNPPASCRKQIW